MTVPRFVLFDYGNTLVPFGRAEADVVCGGRVGALHYVIFFAPH